MKFLIAGLGNVGAEYEGTRHNIGFDIVDALAAKHKATFAQERLAFKTQLSFYGKKLHLIKPTTFVNRSGRAVAYWINHLKIPLQHLLVITDDIALPFGFIRIRAKGGDGGHNGLRNIIETLGTEEFPRLRFGIGNNFPPGHQVDYVLGRWTEEEKRQLPEKIEQCCEAVKIFVREGIQQAMTQFNRR